MIDVSDESIVVDRRTSGGRFVLFCSTDLPHNYLLPWWSAMIDFGGDAAAILVRLDESTGAVGWTLQALLKVAVARAKSEAAVKRSTLTDQAIRHLELALGLENQRRAGLPEASELEFDPIEPEEVWSWLAITFADENCIEFCPDLTGDDSEGINLETLVLLLDQLIKDSGIAFPDQGQFGGMGLYVEKALDLVSKRDRGLRSRR